MKTCVTTADRVAIALAGLMLVLAYTPNLANAQATLTWDIVPGTVGPGNGTITGGSGTWNTTNGNWTTDGGANNIAWDNVTGTPKNDAIIGGTAGTVTLGEAISLRNLTINTANYIITGSTLNFTSGNINLTQASTIRSAITGSPTMTDGGASSSITYLNPTSGNMTLGAITRAVDKHLYLQGSASSQNSIASIAKGHANAKLRVESGNWTFGNVYAGEFQISGGTLTLNGTLNNDYRSTKLLTGGTINYNNAGAIRDGSATFGTTNNDFVLNGGVLDQTSGAAITTSTHNPDMDWVGNWTFKGSNGANSNLFLGNGRVNLNGGTRQVTVENSATTLALGGVIQQVGGTGNGLTKAGAGTLELRGANTFTGTLTIAAGTLSVPTINNESANGTLGNRAGAVLLGSAGNTGTLSYTGGTASTTKPFTAVSGGTAAFSVTNAATVVTLSGAIDGTGDKSFGGAGTYVVSGAISGGNVIKTGAGTLTLANSNGQANTTVNAGRLNINQFAALGTPAGTLTMAGGTSLDNTSGAAVTITNPKSIALGNSLTFLGTNDLDLGEGTTTLSATTTFTVSAGTLTLSGDVVGAGFGIVKEGTGTLRLDGLSGTGSFTGDSAINAGTLFVNGSLAAGSAVSVGASGTLGGTGTINGAATIFGTHTPGNSPGSQTFASNLTYSGGSSAVEWELVGNTITNVANPNAVYDQILVNGSLDFAGATSLGLLFNGLGSSVLWADQFWDADQQWTLYDVAGSTTNFGNLSLAAGSYLDSASNPLASARPNASFNVVQSGSDVLINYVAVPEPATIAILGTGLALVGLRVARRRKTWPANTVSEAAAGPLRA